MTRLRTLVRGLTSLATLLAIVAGLPLLLARWGTLPGAPSKEWMKHLGDQAASDTTVFTVLTLAAWVAWILFTATVVVEAAAAMRGIQAPRIAVAGPLQRSARTLVASVVLLLSLANTQASYASQLPAMATATATPLRTAVVVENLRTATEVGATAPLAAPVPIVGEREATPVVIVERGDNPWRIAEIHLGDGMRWRELFDLNCGVPQPDGRAWTDPELILPGWELRLPTSLDTTTAAPTAPPAADVVHVVVRGDTLSSIAEHYLGDPNRYPEVFDANRDIVQPDGRRLTDPNLIVVGWTLRISGIAAPVGPTITPTPTTSPPPTTNDRPPPSTAPAPRPTTAAPAPSTTIQPTTTAPATTAPPVATPTTSAPVEAAPDNGDRGTVFVGIAGALALATGLALRFRWLHRRRATRGRTNESATVGRAELAALTAADVPLVRWAGQHLAALVQHLDRRDITAAPSAVELAETTGLEILWDEPQLSTPYGAWTVADGGWAWRLTYDPDAPLPAEQLPAGLPALVTIGQRDGRQLLVDLEAFGHLSIVGPTEHTEALARAIALELACGTELADAYVTTVGLDLDPVLAARHRLTSRTAEEAVESIRNAATSVRDVLDHEGISDTFRARLSSSTPIEATAVIAVDISEPSLARLRETALPRSGVVVVTTTPGETAPDGPHIAIRPDGLTARLEPLGVEFVPAGVSAATTAAVAEAMTELIDLPDTVLPAVEEAAPDVVDASLHTIVESDDAAHGEPTRDATDVAEPDTSSPTMAIGGFELVEVHGNASTIVSAVEPLSLDDHGGELEPVADAPTTGRHFESDASSAVDSEVLLVRVLGAPTIPERPDIGRRELIVAVMLACRGGSLAASAAQDALWGGKPVEPKTVWNLITATRKALGEFADGTPVMPAADRTHSTLKLDRRVVTDLDLLRAAVIDADSLPSSRAIATLRDALGLVTGMPFDAPGYDWAHRDQEVTDATRVIESAVDRLVALAADAGQHEIARDAIRLGLRGLPGDEHLYRTRMRLEARVGNMRGVVAAYEELTVYLDDIESEPSPVTTALYNDLRHQGSTKVTA